MATRDHLLAVLEAVEDAPGSTVDLVGQLHASLVRMLEERLRAAECRGLVYRHYRLWRITDAGREWLDASRRK